jgi:hypothetical protein
MENSCVSFNPQYSQFVKVLPKFILEKIKKQIEKKYQMGDANEDISNIFQKYKQQYDKKRACDLKYFSEKKTTHNMELQEELKKIKEENEKYKSDLIKATNAVKKLGDTIRELKNTPPNLRNLQIKTPNEILNTRKF